MSDSGLSSVLSSPPASEDEKIAPIFLKAKMSAAKKGQKKGSKAVGPPPTPQSPPRPAREPSPPHEPVLADNPDIPVRSVVIAVDIIRVQKRDIDKIVYSSSSSSARVSPQLSPQSSPMSDLKTLKGELSILRLLPR